MRYDVVYLYRHKDTPALRYSLRSLENVPHRDVFIVGDCPPWVKGVIHIPHKFKGTKINNEWAQLLKACDHTAEFLLFNDDFYILAPLPTYMYIKDDIRRSRRSAYYNAYLRTKALFKEPFTCYEVHAPMAFDSDMLKRLQNEYDILGGQYLHRSLYGNHYRLGGIRVKDNKIRHTGQVEAKTKDHPFASSTDTIEKSQQFKRVMKALFPKPCRYEDDNIS